MRDGLPLGQVNILRTGILFCWSLHKFFSRIKIQVGRYTGEMGEMGGKWLKVRWGKKKTKNGIRKNERQWEEKKDNSKIL